MANSLHVSLPEDLRRFVNNRTDGKSDYSTPSEYVRSLIRRDMSEEAEKRYVFKALLVGADQIERQEFVPETFMEDLIKQYEK